MDLREKVEKALTRTFKLDDFYLDDDGGISGYIVSSEFQGMPSLDRQKMISKALRHSPLKLTRAELGRVLAIAPLTPVEFAAVEARK